MFVTLWLVAIFLVGLCVGSFLNVCIYRLPWEKNVLWPGSHCGHCFQAIRWYDNLPILSWLLLRGKCRTCGARFSFRYLFIELFTGLTFAGLFYLIAIVNIHDFVMLRGQAQFIAWGHLPPWPVWVAFGHHALLLSFLIVAFFIDLDHREIPFSITIPGTLVGLVFALVWPWPWPQTPAQAPLPPAQPWWVGPPANDVQAGLYPWPVWSPLSDWLPPGSWQLGLATGIAGVVGAATLLYLIRELFTRGLGVEAMGLGDADLLMMAGAFLGWQPAVLAFFVSTFPGLVFGLGYLGLQAFRVRRYLQLVLRLEPETRQPTFILEGTPVAAADLPAALTETAAKLGRKGLYVDFTALDVLVDEWETVIREAARGAGVRQVQAAQERRATDMLTFAVRSLFAKLRQWLRPSVTTTLTVQVKYEDDKIGYQIDDQPLTANQLGGYLKRSVKQPQRTILLVDTSRLDQWFQGLLTEVQETAHQAEVGTVQLGERGFPFGPALATGIVLTMLAWNWLGPRVQPLFFDGTFLLVLGVFGGILIFGMSRGLRLLRRRSPVKAAD